MVFMVCVCVVLMGGGTPSLRVIKSRYWRKTGEEGGAPRGEPQGAPHEASCRTFAKKKLFAHFHPQTEDADRTHFFAWQAAPFVGGPPPPFTLYVSSAGRRRRARARNIYRARERESIKSSERSRFRVIELDIIYSRCQAGQALRAGGRTEWQRAHVSYRGTAARPPRCKATRVRGGGGAAYAFMYIDGYMVLYMYGGLCRCFKQELCR